MEKPVSIYALASPSSVTSLARDVRRTLLQLLRVPDEERHRVHVSPGSGWIEYRDIDVAQSVDGVRTPADSEPARKVAETFLREFRARCSELQSRAPDFDTRAFLPSLRPLDCEAIPARSGRGWTHFLYRAQPTLPLRPGGSSVDVLGTAVQVRISPQGRVIGFMSSWRPLSGERIQARFLAATSHEEESHEHEHEHEHAPANEESELVYILDGDGVPQYYLAPYHRPLEEHGAIAGASPYSLTIEFVVRPLEDEPGARVTAIVAGGSAGYRFAWGRCALGGTDDEGFADLGETQGERVTDAEERAFGASAITLPPGTWVVFVNVKDILTGAFKHYQQVVFTGRQITEAQEN